MRRCKILTAHTLFFSTAWISIPGVQCDESGRANHLQKELGATQCTQNSTEEVFYYNKHQSIEASLKKLNKNLGLFVNDSNFDHAQFEVNADFSRSELSGLEILLEDLCDEFKATKSIVAAMADASQQFEYYKIPSRADEKHLRKIIIIKLRAMSLWNINSRTIPEHVYTLF